MADNDLDKYLEDIGITTEEEQDTLLDGLPNEREEPETLPVPGVVRVEGNVQERCESFLVDLLINFDPAYAVEITRADEDEVVVEIFGGDPGKIIGRAGRTLSALEYVTNAVLNQGESSGVRVNIDVGGYKRRRDDRLRQSAHKAAGRVRKTGQPVEMDPMSAAERRVIHMALADDPTVMSESTGEGRDRRVVVKLR